MKYFMHNESGTVTTLGDHEDPQDRLPGGVNYWTPVHFHKGAKEPGAAAKIAASLFGLSLLGAAVGLLALVWKAVLS